MTDVDIPDASGLVIALDNFTPAHRSEVLLDVLAGAQRHWLLFGRRLVMVLRIDDQRYEGPTIGALKPFWNGREWANANRGL